MSDLDLAKTDPKKQLFDQIDEISAGMLGLDLSRQHMQPMAPLVDVEGERIWFFAKNDSDLVKSIDGEAAAHFVVVGDDHDYHACVSGTLRTNKKQDRIDAYWNSVVAAWFDGKDDPNLTMLEFVPRDAAIWASSGNPIVFGWEVAKANLTDGEPDVGVRAHVEFA